MVAAFTTEHPQFRLLHCGELLNQQRIALDTGLYLKLMPQMHATDGFFAAAMERAG
jgi:16S rRNA (cytosine967-C5)-methyltransferase